MSYNIRDASQNTYSFADVTRADGVRVAVMIPASANGQPYSNANPQSVVLNQTLPVTIANTVTVTYSNTVPVSLNQTVPVSIASAVTVQFANSFTQPVSIANTVAVSLNQTVPVSIAGAITTNVQGPVTLANTVTLPVSISNNNPIYMIRYQIGKATNRVSLNNNTETVLVPINTNKPTLIESITVANVDTLPTVVDLRDSNNGTIIQTIVVPAVDTRQLCWDEGLIQANANNAWTVRLRNATDTYNVDISVVYRIA